MTDAPVPQHVLILGAARSGTTLAASLLGHHPDAAVLNEDMRMGMRFVIGKKVVGNKILVPFEIAMSRKRGFWIRAFCRTGLLKAFQRVGLLTTFFPGSYYSIGDYLEIDGLKALLIVRDPDDVISSMIRRDANWTASYATRNWVDAVEIMCLVRQRLGPRARVIVFEDLVTEPECVLRDVCAFVGLDFDPRMLDGCRFNPTYPETAIRPERAGRALREKLGYGVAESFPETHRKYLELAATGRRDG